MRRAAKTDQNQEAIVEALRDYGAVVTIIADVGRGVPDLLVLVRGDFWLVECKMPGEGLTPAQRDWHKDHAKARRLAIVFGPYDALSKLNLVHHSEAA